MYANRSHVKKDRIPVRLDEAGKRKLESLAEISHKQPAALARDLLMEAMDELERELLEKLGNVNSEALKRG